MKTTSLVVQYLCIYMSFVVFYRISIEWNDEMQCAVCIAALFVFLIRKYNAILCDCRTWIYLSINFLIENFTLDSRYTRLTIKVCIEVMLSIMKFLNIFIELKCEICNCIFERLG